MFWDFHGLAIEGATNDDALRDHWQRTFASRPSSHAPPDITCTLTLATEVPPRPSGQPDFRQGDLLEYFLDGDTAIGHFPRFGQLRLNLADGRTEGALVSAALETYGVFEDLLAIGLSPHLRRRGMFLIHAFAGSPPPRPSPVRFADKGGRGVLIVGNVGAGKTTTGMALLNAGWKLLSNDSPIINESAEVLSYPGLLAAYPDTLARFPATARFAAADERQKSVFAAESIWPDVWADRAPAAAIFFPQIESRADHAVEPISQPEALRMILPHAVEQWDRAMIPGHLAALNTLIQSAPAYRLRLGPDTSTIPDTLLNLQPIHRPQPPGLCG